MAVNLGDPQHEAEQRFEQLIGNLLIAGVATAALVVLAGGITYLIRRGGQHPGYSIFQGEPVDFRTVRGIFESSKEWSGRGLIQLGLMLLIATPVARVTLSLIVFLRQKDGLYAVFTLIVLGVLLFSLAGHRF